MVTFLLIGCCNKEEIPRRIDDLYSGEARIRNDAALALARCGAEADRATTKLGSLLYDSNVGVQSAAAYALRKIATPRAQSILREAEERREAGRYNQTYSR